MKPPRGGEDDDDSRRRRLGSGGSPRRTAGEEEEGSQRSPRSIVQTQPFPPCPNLTHGAQGSHPPSSIELGFLVAPCVCGAGRRGAGFRWIGLEQSPPSPASSCTAWIPPPPRIITPPNNTQLALNLCLIHHTPRPQPTPHHTQGSGLPPSLVVPFRRRLRGPAAARRQASRCGVCGHLQREASDPARRRARWLSVRRRSVCAVGPTREWRVRVGVVVATASSSSCSSCSSSPRCCVALVVEGEGPLLNDERRPRGWHHTRHQRTGRSQQQQQQPQPQPLQQ